MDTTAAHTFIPTDDSLISRVDALKTVLGESRNLKASESMIKDADWERRLGEADEIEFAKRTILNSLKKARESISQTELNEAIKRNLISEVEVTEMIATERLQEAQVKRSKSKQVKHQARHRHQRS